MNEKELKNIETNEITDDAKIEAQNPKQLDIILQTKKLQMEKAGLQFQQRHEYVNKNKTR